MARIRRGLIGVTVLVGLTTASCSSASREMETIAGRSTIPAEAADAGTTIAPTTVGPIDPTTTSSAPSTTAEQVTPSRPATVAVVGEDLVWFDPTGAVSATRPLPQRYGYSTGVAGVSERIVIQIGDALEILDPADPAGESTVLSGSYTNHPVLVVDDGYWAADRMGFSGPATWRRYDWSGTPTAASPVTLTDPEQPEDSFAVLAAGEVERGLVAWSMATGNVFAVHNGGSVIIGHAPIVAVSKTCVVYLEHGKVWRRDIGSTSSVTILDPQPYPALAQTSGASAFDPTETKVAALFADENSPDNAVLLVVDPTEPQSARTMQLAGLRTVRLQWVDERFLLVSGGDVAHFVDSETMTAVESWPIDPGTQLFPLRSV